MNCFGDRVLVARHDGVREIVCEGCYCAPGIIESVEIASDTPCQTEIAPFAWKTIPGGWPRHQRSGREKEI